jgi:bacteriocin-like protein
MADEQEVKPDTTPAPQPAPQRDPAELSEDELEKVSGGLAGSCTKGKHIPEVTIE